MRRHRVLDVVLVALLLVPALIVGVVIAALILVDSPGPVLYRARRLGRHGRPFDMLKFRKMREDARGCQLTCADDERFTPIGRFLARTRLDELPQLINVLRGDMHFVGPRPEVEAFVGAYPDDYRRILSVRPGITGLTQLRFAHEARLMVGTDDPEAYYVDTILPLKIASDLEYVERRSIRGDLVILLRTTLVSLRLTEGVRREPDGSAPKPAVVYAAVVLPALVLLAGFVFAAGPLH